MMFESAFSFFEVFVFGIERIIYHPDVYLSFPTMLYQGR